MLLRAILSAKEREEKKYTISNTDLGGIPIPNTKILKHNLRINSGT